MAFHDTDFHQPTYGDYTSPDLAQVVQDLQKDGDKAKEVDIIEVRTGSDSDFPKIQPLLDNLKAKNIPYVLRILSAHRTAEAMMEGAQAFPQEKLPPAIQDAIDMNKLRVKLCVAAAGGSAHIAGMTASETPTPVLALPVIGSAMGRIDAMLSMLNMPPGVPNGFVSDNDTASEISEKLYNLQLDSDDNRVSFGNTGYMPEMSPSDKKLMHSLGLIDDTDAKVSIHTQSLGGEAIPSDSRYNIIIPTVFEKIHNVIALMKIFNNGLNSSGVYMGVQREKSTSDVSQQKTLLESLIGFFQPLKSGKGKNMEEDRNVTISYTNAIIHAAQILANTNPSIKRRLDGYREQLAREVKRKDAILAAEQFGLMTPLKQKLLESGLWPADKEITFEKGEPELEALGYDFFYRGKNADMYLVPDTEPMQVLMLRSDRTSVFDIKLDLEIEGKGAIQTQISKLGVDFVEKNGAKTCFTELPDNLPDSLADRCQTMELCAPITVEIDGQQKGVEFIVRNYITGSLLEKYIDDPDGDYGPREDPYELNLPEGMEEWDQFPEPVFTPTTKELSGDEPIAAHIVETALPEIVKMVKRIFAEFTQFAYERGYVLIDGKCEITDDGRFMDEIFTPESCRFIQRADFEAKIYKSADKQIIRNLGEKFKWKKRMEEILEVNPKAEKRLKVAYEVPENSRRELLDGYTDIHTALT